MKINHEGTRMVRDGKDWNELLKNRLNFSDEQTVAERLKRISSLSATQVTVEKSDFKCSQWSTEIVFVAQLQTLLKISHRKKHF